MNKLNFDNAIRMLPEFAGLPTQDLNLFEKKCEFVFKHIDETIVNDVLEALLCNLSGKALYITQHKVITNYKDLNLNLNYYIEGEFWKQLLGDIFVKAIKFHYSE